MDAGAAGNDDTEESSFTSNSNLNQGGNYNNNYFDYPKTTTVTTEEVDHRRREGEVEKPYGIPPPAVVVVQNHHQQPQLHQPFWLQADTTTNSSSTTPPGEDGKDNKELTLSSRYLNYNTNSNNAHVVTPWEQNEEASPTHSRRVTTTAASNGIEVQLEVEEEEQQRRTVDAADNEGKLNFRALSRRTKFLLLLCIAAEFWAGCSFSLIAPFFPQEAEKKGMSITLTGFVFSVYELIIFLTSPLLGAYLTDLGPKFVFISGIAVGGTCNILFGLLDKCPSGMPFIASCMACRIVEAAGFSAYVTALLAIMTSEFPKDAATSLAVLETANGIGLMAGPAIGGIMYDFGGFGFPFYVIGGIVILNGVAIYVFLPAQKESVPGKTKMSKLRFLRSPMVLLGIASIAFGALGISFLDPTLANHLAPFGLSVSVMGLFFVLEPFVYTVFSPIWGYLTDRKGMYREIIVFGHFVFGIGYFLIGPSNLLLPFLPFDLRIIAVGLCLVGASFGCVLIAPMKCMVTGALELGLEENLETYALLGGLLNSMYSLGAFTGPMVGGILVQEIGYASGFTVIGMINICMGIVALVFFVTRSRHHAGSPNFGETV